MLSVWESFSPAITGSVWIIAAGTPRFCLVTRQCLFLKLESVFLCIFCACQLFVVGILFVFCYIKCYLSILSATIPWHGHLKGSGHYTLMSVSAFELEWGRRLYRPTKDIYSSRIIAKVVHNWAWKHQNYSPPCRVENMVNHVRLKEPKNTADI